MPKDKCAESVYHAIKIGYRHIDGAYDYQNGAEAGAGIRKAIKDGLVKREDLFVTSKLWNNYHSRDHAIEMAKAENDAWGIDYLDLYLIHFPIAQKYIPPSELSHPGFWTDSAQTKVAPLEAVPVAETWAALETLVRTGDNPSGILRSLGVANFNAQLLYDLLASHRKVRPALLQVEHHPYLAQPGLVQMAHDNKIAVTAYSSFGPKSFLELDSKVAKEAEPLLEHAVIKKIAGKHGKTTAQVLLRWSTQRDVIVIPKSNNPERLAQNLDCNSFDLMQDDFKAIDALDKGLRFNDPGTMLDPPLRIFA